MGANSNRHLLPFLFVLPLLLDESSGLYAKFKYETIRITRNSPGSPSTKCFLFWFMPINVESTGAKKFKGLHPDLPNPSYAKWAAGVELAGASRGSPQGKRKTC